MANQEVERRIVEMQFDSKDFDKNVRKSQKTLEDFKQSLDFESAFNQMGSSLHASLDQITNLLTKMQKDTENLRQNLTGIGKLSSYIAGKVKQAWQGALRSVESFTKSMTTAQIGEGGQKYNGLLQSVQTIKNATGEAEETVYAVMGKLNQYTDETSYNFADMAQNIGKFTTVGVGLEDAETAMEGIANWAALSGQNAATASRAMYNISQAMSEAMQMRDWRSIQNASMDTRQFREEAIKAAVAVGTLVQKGDKFFTKKGNKQVTVDNFTETLQYKWFDKKTMMEVFTVFADNTQGIGEAAYKAAQRCTTFNDALGAWKDMLSTGWMKSYEHVFGKLTDAMGLFSGLCNKVSEDLSKFVELRNGILERWSLSGRNSLWGALVGELEDPDGKTLFAGAYGLLDVLRDVGKAIYEAFWDFISNFVRDENKALLKENPEKGMAFLATGLTNITRKFQEFTNGIKDFLFKADPGETETRFDRIKHVAEAIYSVILLIVNVVRGVSRFGKELLAQLYPSIHAVELLIDYLMKMFTGAVVEGAKKNTIGNFFHKLAELLRPVTSVINVFVQALVQFIAKIVAMMSKSGLLKTLGSAIQFVAAAIGKGLSALLNSGLLQTLFDWIQKAVSNIPSVIQKIKKLGATFLTTAKNSKAMKGFTGFISSLFGGKGIKDILKSIKNGINNLLKKIPELLPSLKTGLSGLFEKIFGFLGGLFVSGASAEGADSVTTKLAETIAEPIKKLGDGSILKTAFDKAKPGFLQNLKTKFSEFWNSFTETLTTIANSDAMKKIKSFFAGTTFKDLFFGFRDIMKWLSIFRAGSGLVSMGKGLKSIGKGVKFFSKNMKYLNLSEVFKNMFNISNVINSNNSDSSIRKSFDFGKLGNQLLQIAAAIGVVTWAATALAKMKPDELKQAGIAIGIILTALIGAGYIAKKATKGSSGLMSLAMSVLLLIVPMKILQKMKWGPLLDGFAKLVLLMLALAGAARLAGTVKMKGFVGMAVALNLLLIPIKVLSKMTLYEADGSGLVAAMGTIIVLMLAMSTAAAIAGGNKLKGFLALSVAFNLLLIPIKVLSSMNWEDIAKGVAPILGILVMITVMIAVTKGANANKLGTIVSAIAALSFIAWLIGHTMNWEQALIGFAPILLLIATMSLMFSQVAKLNIEQIKAVKTIFTALSIMILVIAGAIVAMSVLNVDWKTPTAFMAGLIGIILSVGAMMKLAEWIKADSIGKIALVIGLTSLIIAVAGAALIGMAHFKVDWGMILTFMLGLVGIIGALAIAIPILGAIDPMTAVKGILVLAAAIVAIMGAVSLIMPVLLGSIGEGMRRMASDMKLMATLFTDFFIKIMAISEGQIGHAMEVFDAIKLLILKFSGFGNFEAEIRSVMSQLNAMGAGLTSFFMNDARYPDPDKAQSFKALKGFIEIGPSLASFTVGNLPRELLYTGVGLMLFQEATKDITSAESTALDLLGNIITSATSSTGKINETLGKEIMYFGQGIRMFGWATAGIKDANPPALQMLQGIFGQANNIEKFVQLPLGDFRSQMSGLGGAMSLYAKGAKEVTGLGGEDGVDDIDISNSVEILKKVCSAISGESGEGAFKIPDNMPDEAATGLFAGQLESLGNALGTFATSAAKMEGSSDNAIELLKLLGEIGGYLTAENLSHTKAFDEAGIHAGNGEGTLGQFALDVGALGTALEGFATVTANKGFDNGLGALTHLSELNSLLTADAIKFAGVFTDASIDNTILSQFALDIGALGTALSSFSGLTENTAFDNGFGALDHLFGLNNRLTADRLKFLFVFDSETKTVLGTFADDVLLLGQALGALKTNTTDSNGNAYDFSSAVDSLESLAAMQIKLSTIKLDGVAQWFTGNSATLGTLARDVESLGGALADFSEAITGVGEGKNAFNAEAALNTMEVLGKMISIINSINVGNNEYLGYTGLAYELTSFFSILLGEWDTGSNPFVDGSFIAAIAKFAQDLTTVFNSTEGIDSAAVAMFNNLANGLAAIVAMDTSETFVYPGKMIAEGIATGVEQGRSRVVQAIIDVVQAGIDAGNATAVIKSPSRVFAEMGEYMDAGLVQGLTSGKDKVGAAGSEAVQSAISGATGIMAAISQAMAEETDLQPTIAPVLDLSNITGAGSVLDSLFSGYSLRLDAVLEKAIAATNKNGPTEVIVQNPTDLTGIQQAIGTLQRDIIDMGNAISNIKIVLNTGTIAGDMTDDIDHNLGRKSLYNSRRN